MAWATASLLLASACGIHEGAQPAEDGSPRWEGTVSLATQCPYGMISNPRVPYFHLKGCPLDVSVLRLTKPPSTLLFSGDCREKTLAIRTADLTLDTLWQVTPDDRFNLSVGPVWTQLSADADGHSQCWTAADVYVRGSLECQDQDRMRIRFEEISLLLSPESPSQGIAPDGQLCHLPSSCELTTQATLNQCI